MSLTTVIADYQRHLLWSDWAWKCKISRTVSSWAQPTALNVQALQVL